MDGRACPKAFNVGTLSEAYATTLLHLTLKMRGCCSDQPLLTRLGVGERGVGERRRIDY